MADPAWHRAYRLRRSQQLARRGEALQAIIAELVGNEKPLAEKLRCIAWAGLADS